MSCHLRRHFERWEWPIKSEWLNTTSCYLNILYALLALVSELSESVVFWQPQCLKPALFKKKCIPELASHSHSMLDHVSLNSTALFVISFGEGTLSAYFVILFVIHLNRSTWFHILKMSKIDGNTSNFQIDAFLYSVCPVSPSSCPSCHLHVTCCSPSALWRCLL